jgi:hypothetical protein
MNKLFYALLFLLISCSAHERKIGGEEVYKGENITVENKQELADKTVKITFRDSPRDYQMKAFRHPHGSLKRIGFMFFETIIQSTRDGLSHEENYFFTNHAKQLITEDLYKRWISRLEKLNPELKFIKVEDEFIKNKTFSSYTEDFLDYSTKLGDTLLADDIQYLVKGKTTSMNNLMMPRKFKDLSLMSAPLATFLGDTKPSDYHKYWINDVATELNLDAILVVFSQLEWNRTSPDALDPKKINPEGAKLKIESTISIPYKRFQKILISSGFNPDINPGSVAFRKYESKAFIDLKIEKPNIGENSQDAFYRLIGNRVFNAYDSMTDLILSKMETDLIGTTK